VIAKRSGSVRPRWWGEGYHGAQKAEGLFAFVYGFCVACEGPSTCQQYSQTRSAIPLSRMSSRPCSHRMTIHSRPARSILPHVSLSSRYRRARYAAALLLDVASSARKGNTLSRRSGTTLVASHEG
jgi:hypothetical protein